MIKFTIKGYYSKGKFKKIKEIKGNGIKNSLYYKNYEMDISGKIVLKTKKFNLNDFKIGFTVVGKLAFKHVKGGVILVPSEFTIKEQKMISKK